MAVVSGEVLLVALGHQLIPHAVAELVVSLLSEEFTQALVGDDLVDEGPIQLGLVIDVEQVDLDGASVGVERTCEDTAVGLARHGFLRILVPHIVHGIADMDLDAGALLPSLQTAGELTGDAVGFPALGLLFLGSLDLAVGSGLLLLHRSLLRIGGSLSELLGHVSDGGPVAGLPLELG